MYKKLLLSAISLLVSAQVMAQSYQYEGTLNYARLETDVSDEESEELDVASVAGIYYFAPVKTAKHPLQEAAFLERNSSVSLGYLRGDAKDSETDSSSTSAREQKTEIKSSTLVIGGEIYLFDMLYIGGHARESRAVAKSTDRIIANSTSAPTSISVDREKASDDDWRLSLGIAPVKGLLAWTDLHKDASKSSSWNINAKYVLEFNNSAVNIVGGYSKNAVAGITAQDGYPSNIRSSYTNIAYEDSEDDSEEENDDYYIDEDYEDYEDENYENAKPKLTSYYLVSDYYFTPTLSLGLGISHVALDEYDETENLDTYLIRGKKYFDNNVSLEIELAQNDYLDFYSLGISKRF